MYKINCLNPIAAIGMDIFTDAYEKTDDFSEAQVAMVRSAAMHDMDLPDSLLAVARAGAGVNNIPLDKCAEKGIVVFNTPGANANGVKELVIAGLLMATRNVVAGAGWVTDNKSDPDIAKSVEKGKKAFAGTEILGKKIGVIGLGAIGAMVANACDALGMIVTGYDPFLNDAMKEKLSGNVATVTDINEIYKNSDFISIHVPAMDATKKMINKAAFDQMKDGVVVLNYARDVLVDDDAMEAAIKAGKVAKYVTDFPNAKTANMEGVILTPHLGASTAESEDNCAIMAAKEVRDFIENGNVKNSVNYPAVDLGICTASGRIAVCAKASAGVDSKLAGIIGETSAVAANTKGDWMYILADTKAALAADAAEKVKALDGVLKVRIVK
ncbi:MAG: 3-phosphoglycerate dehydrogenase [Clostridia bacterium]|nr:3-phosphoglycerate dehydrogenase [Lachnospiraceae bacterium]NCB99178.1 3-phosphoglycerate dehydrogenase [Clostridia bacterium]NCD02213.1 3-phosphoglycerate dehydrogenase [Clostridia bacterium]